MPHYAYVVKDKTGRTHRGTFEGDSKQNLIDQLWKQGFVVLSIDERQAKAFGARLGSPSVKANQLAIFSRQLATMVASGIPIVGALDALADQMEDHNLSRILKRVRDEIEGGSSLSECLIKHPKAFSEFFVSMVKAGESSGRLDEILDRVSAYLEKSEALRHKVQSSLFYPTFISIVAMLITGGLVVFVVPKFKDIFSAFGGDLPAPTQMLLNFSEFTRRFLVLEVIAIVAAIVAFNMYAGTKAGQMQLDKFKLRLPVLGKLFQKVAIARFSRTLATLVRSGVPILTSLDITAKTAGNRVIEAAIVQARSSIKEGENIADPLAASKTFPPMVTRMISVGEKTGEMEKMLSKIADFYEVEVDAAVAGLTSLIEPLIISFLGVVIGGIVVALFLPIFQVSTLVGR